MSLAVRKRKDGLDGQDGLIVLPTTTWVSLKRSLIGTHIVIENSYTCLQRPYPACHDPCSGGSYRAKRCYAAE
jgi:hypothetical protein